MSVLENMEFYSNFSVGHSEREKREMVEGVLLPFIKAVLPINLDFTLTYRGYLDKGDALIYTFYLFEKGKEDAKCLTVEFQFDLYATVLRRTTFMEEVTRVITDIITMTKDARLVGESQKVEYTRPEPAPKRRPENAERLLRETEVTN